MWQRGGRGRGGGFNRGRQQQRSRFNNNYGRGGNNPNHIDVPEWRTQEQIDGVYKEEVKEEEIHPKMSAEDRAKDKERRKILKMKKWRLIIRNLPFSITEEKMKETFKAYGDIAEIVLPKKKTEDGKEMLRGFGFVQFFRYPDAFKARNELNAKELEKRPIAVDWAAPKDEYLSATVKDKPIETKEEDVPKVEVKEEVEEMDANEKESSDDEESDTDTPTSVEEEEEPEKKKRKRNNKAEPKPPKADEGIQQGRTLFVRNLSFDTTSEELKEFFEKFGTVNYALVCKHPDSDHSKGTGFVQYEKVEDADNVLVKAERIEQLDKGLKLDGRWLMVCKAMEKSRAKEMEESKKEKEPKDKRNLNLMRIGFIRQGTEAANGMSDEDAAKRMKIAAANKLKIKNLHIFVSTTRLCVHNIPATVNDATLREICAKSVNDSSAKILECRVMRDKDRLNSSGLGKSRGFAFVEFAQHGHALAALKNLNNNPAIFSDKKRPIVEFSLENLVALNRKKFRAEKSKQDQPEVAEGMESTKKNKKRKLKKEKNEAKEVEGAAEKTFPVKQNVADTKKALKGLKPLPARLGPKLRHKKKKKDSSVKESLVKPTKKRKPSRKDRRALKEKKKLQD